MSISLEARRLIDEALAQGRVTVVPSGLQALAPAVVKRRPGRPRKGEAPAGDKIAARKAERADADAVRVRDRRRFKTTPVPVGEPFKMAAADATGTMYPTRVMTPGPAEPVLKDGSSNSKIGGDVFKGWLRGARIVTLTLEERATCPRSCAIWRGCYGNGMQHPRRWRHGPELDQAIAREVADLCATHVRVLVRLHVLGDFYSLEYLALWARLLDEHAGLAVFGFTAWPPGTPIGDGVARLRAAVGRRFSIRHSGRSGAWGSFTIDFPTAKARIGDAVICPEQREAMAGRQGRHCGNCALCWQSDLPVVFVEH